MKQWMTTFELETSSIGHITTAWMVGKFVGLGMVWSDQMGKYDVCVMVTLLSAASWWTRQSFSPRDLFIGYGLEGCGAVIFGWWAPVILMRVDPTRFQFWSTILSALNIISVCAGGALYGALEPVMTWRGIWFLRSLILSVSSLGILLCTFSYTGLFVDQAEDGESVAPLVNEMTQTQTQTNQALNLEVGKEPRTCVVPAPFSFSLGRGCWSLRRTVHYVSTLVSVVATIAVLESFSYWGMLYLEREYHYEHTPKLQVRCGIILTLLGASAIVCQSYVIRWKGDSAVRTKRLHQQFMCGGQLVCCVVCIALALTHTLDQFAVLFLGMLTPVVCMLLSSCCYLVGTTASPKDRRVFTIVMELSVLLLTQWMSPILFGYILDHAIHATFFIFASMFLLGSTGALVSIYSEPEHQSDQNRPTDFRTGGFPLS